ncbi:MAG: hypothetical protein JJU42_00875 [Rhodobacteraceae bacterium]|nr:hypothetical protein [Paracoccaceae bacterium]
MLSLAGPGIWAAGFTLVYALHGTGCARGWPEAAAMGPVTLHAAALWAGWLVTLATGALLLRLLPAVGAGAGLRRDLPRAGAWIGLGATLFTLLPVAVASSC